MVCYRESDEVCTLSLKYYLLFISIQIVKWLNLNSTRKLIGADPEVVVYDTVNLSVNHDFEGHDMLQSSTGYVAQLLERGESLKLAVPSGHLIVSWFARCPRFGICGRD